MQVTPDVIAAGRNVRPKSNKSQSLWIVSVVERTPNSHPYFDDTACFAIQFYSCICYLIVEMYSLNDSLYSDY